MANNDSNAEVVLNSSFTQSAADNVDHNVCTLDGKDTFHGMGIIAAGMISPMNVDNQQRIKRIRYGLKAAEIVSKAKFRFHGTTFRYSRIDKDAFQAHSRTSVTTAFFTVSRHRPFLTTFVHFFC